MARVFFIISVMNNQSPPRLNTDAAADDVRMKGFKQRATVDSAINWLNQQNVPLNHESIAIQQALGRQLATDIISQYDIPGFNRSMMDGFAIIAADAQGASTYNPLPLQVIDSSMPGYGTESSVQPGTAIKIMTGAPVPAGANAVLPAENVEYDDPVIYVAESVAEGRNIGQVGEDIQQGETTLHQGRKLRPQDIALLASIGVTHVSVLTPPKIKIVITGNEILPVGKPPQGYNIVNSNGLMLELLCQRDGATIVDAIQIPDDAQSIRQTMQDDFDVLIMTGGTSVGEEDLAPLILSELGELAIHGITMRPSRSTAMGSINSKPVFLLPGNPVACLCAYDFFAGKLIRRLAGFSESSPYTSQSKKLQSKLVSMLGRTDYARVKICPDNSGYIQPISISGAGILSSTTQADGFVIIPSDSEGYAPETDVQVYLYD